MKQFECGKLVPGCDGVVTGATDDEVLAAAATHAKDVHGMDQVSDEMAAAIRAAISQANA